MGRAKLALEYVECGKGEDEVAPDLQAFLVGDPDIEDQEEIVVYCDDCARREFGPFDAELRPTRRSADRDPSELSRPTECLPMTEGQRLRHETPNRRPHPAR